MSVIDTVISTMLLAGAGVLLVGWLLVQLVGEVLYRRYERALPRWPQLWPRRAGTEPAGVES